MRLELLSIAGAVATILIIPTALSAQGGAVNAVAAARGAVVRGVPTSADLGTSSSSSSSNHRNLNRHSTAPTKPRRR